MTRLPCNYIKKMCCCFFVNFQKKSRWCYKNLTLPFNCIILLLYLVIILLNYSGQSEWPWVGSLLMGKAVKRTKIKLKVRSL